MPAGWGIDPTTRTTIASSGARGMIRRAVNPAITAVSSPSTALPNSQREVEVVSPCPEGPAKVCRYAQHAGGSIVQPPRLEEHDALSHVVHRVGWEQEGRLNAHPRPAPAPTSDAGDEEMGWPSGSSQGAPERTKASNPPSSGTCDGALHKPLHPTGRAGGRYPVIATRASTSSTASPRPVTTKPTACPTSPRPGGGASETDPASLGIWSVDPCRASFTRSMEMGRRRPLRSRTHAKLHDGRDR